MPLAVGDHLRIQRNGRLIEPNEEAYVEFEVEGSIQDDVLLEPHSITKPATDSEPDGRPYYDIRIRVVR